MISRFDKKIAITTLICLFLDYNLEKYKVNIFIAGWTLFEVS